MSSHPSSVEWLGLLAGTFVSCGASLCYTGCAIAYHWTGRAGGESGYKPHRYSTETYSTIRFASHFLMLMGWWFAWREGYRLETGIQPTEDGSASMADLFFVNLFYYLHVCLSGIFGLTFFHVGLLSGWLGIPLFFEIASLAFGVVACIYAWFVWWMAGMLMVIALGLSLYTVTITVLFWMHGPHGIYSPLILRLRKAVLDLRELTSKPQPSSHVISVAQEPIVSAGVPGVANVTVGGVPTQVVISGGQSSPVGTNTIINRGTSGGYLPLGSVRSRP